ncbi:MAG: serine/threonine-protein kinase [Acidobacteria bacterium]|nr:serine/threonine-protein kinase [Acidobacteriota bacterium]
MIGQTFSHYRITAAIGAGGMGEVYRATDTNLDREVAIKVLPAEVAQDPDRLGRFKREAHLLASLNHPNVAAIYGLEEADGKPFLALELVEGEDLKERLARGPIPVDEAVEVAEQIAEALEEAHAKGIVHRDLKPANVKLTPDGKVKVLDFGLAKAWTGDGGSGASSTDLSQSPTLAHTGTAAGLILGTAAYMSPEQASGRPVDKRADIWAFGAVLFEMLTGQRLFAGDNVSELLASVLKEEPAWERLPEGAPRSLDRLLRRCLRKKPRERLHDIGDARLEIEEARQELVAGPADSTRASRDAQRGGRERLAWALAAVLAVAAAGLAMGWLSSRGPVRLLHLSVPLAPARLDGAFAVSPDGSRVAFGGVDEDGDHLLYVRALDEPAARALPGTEDALAPFFSPDGEWIAFFGATRPLKKVPANGGPVVTVAEGNLRDSVGTWTHDGWIVITQPTADRPGELLRVRAEGGPLEPLPTTDEHARGFVASVSTIPGVSALLLTTGHENASDHGVQRVGQGGQAVAVQLLETGERHVLVSGGSQPRPLAGGQVVYRASGGLMAQRFDVGGTKLVGPPVPLHAVTGEGNVDWFDVSLGGTLVFVTRLEDEHGAHLVRTGRDGRTTPLAPEVTEGGFDPRLSPDGTRLVIDRQLDLWVLALERGTLARISSAPGEDETGVWSPDGRWIAWAGSRPGEKRALLRRRSDGSGPEELLWSDERHFHVASWTAAGIVVTVDDEETGWDVLLVDLGDPDEARTVLNGQFNESSARVSPDGHLLAFVSDETGRNEVYVQSFPRPGGKVQVSLDGGVQPVWRPGSREILYRGSGNLMSVTLGPESPPTMAAPRALFDDRLTGLDEGDHTAFAVEGDGSLLAVEEPDRPPIRDLRIALDWTKTVGLAR